MFYLFAITCSLTFLATLDLFYLKVFASFELLLLFYFLSGFFWYQYECRKPRIDVYPVFWQTGLTMDKIIFFILWPLVSIRRAYEYFDLRKRHDRFSVLSEKSKIEEHFGSWDDAFEYAHSEANRLGQNTSIFDNAKLRQSCGELTHAMYEIAPNGKVRKCFSFWR